MAEKVRRARNLLGADFDLKSADADLLLVLVDKYCEDPEGITKPFHYIAWP